MFEEMPGIVMIAPSIPKTTYVLKCSAISYMHGENGYFDAYPALAGQYVKSELTQFAVREYIKSLSTILKLSQATVTKEMFVTGSIDAFAQNGMCKSFFEWTLVAEEGYSMPAAVAENGDKFFSHWAHANGHVTQTDIEL